MSKTNNSQHFRKLFFRREEKELLGVNYRNFLFLVFIIFITFTAIGFANGSLQYLKIKMQNPYVLWQSIPTIKENNLVQRITDELNKKKIKDKYSYKNVESYKKFELWLINCKDRKASSHYGRTIEYNDPILRTIQNDLQSNTTTTKNRIFKKDPFSSVSKDIGLIVTKDLLKKLSCNINTPYVSMEFAEKNSDNETIYTPISIPIIGVVSKLPGKNEFACTPYFYQQKNIISAAFHPTHTQDRIMLYTPDTAHRYKLQKIVQDFIKKSEYNVYTPYMEQMERDTLSHTVGFNIRASFNFKTEIDKLTSIDSIYRKLNIYLKEKKSPLFVRRYEYQFRDATTMHHDYISIHFNDLKNIRAFQKFLKNKSKNDDNYLNLNLDLKDVEIAENYHYVTILTKSISFSLIFFCIISIAIFIFNILQNHFTKISMNIGTFKAFGLNNDNLRNIYQILIFKITASAIIIAFVFSLTIGKFLIWRILTITDLEKGETYFDLFNYHILITVFAILFFNYFAFYLASLTFSKTPGNLIYQRN